MELDRNVLLTMGIKTSRRDLQNLRPTLYISVERGFKRVDVTQCVFICTAIRSETKLLSRFLYFQNDLDKPLTQIMD